MKINNSVAAVSPKIKNEVDEDSHSSETCGLGRELGNCPLRRAGCVRLYDAIMHVMPPYHIRLLVRNQMQGDKAAQDWLRRLDDTLPEPRPVSVGWRR